VERPTVYPKHVRASVKSTIFCDAGDMPGAKHHDSLPAVTRNGANFGPSNYAARSLRAILAWPLTVPILPAVQQHLNLDTEPSPLARWPPHF
jgi:hypothetical protein